MVDVRDDRDVAELVRRAMRTRLAARAGEQSSRADVADRGVDELDGMERGQRLPSRGRSALRDLDEAAGVRARVRLRAGREDVRGLAVAELARGLRLR